MKLKIGVMGSHEEPINKTLIKKSQQIGKAIAENDCILVNGATTGLPDEAAYGAKKNNGFVLGISPAHDYKEHIKKYKLPIKNYDTIVYTGFGFNLRNIVNIRTSDGVIFLRGSMGTLNEFTIAYEDKKIIGILEHFGGVSEFIDEIIEICKKYTGAKIIYESDPEELVKKLVKEIKKRNSR
ncbi:hypothetical protein GF327_05765 [Candidatus Woesearchaeota archaeon]|nr:hypothetical protein [Candidatus Woesearchaeota archaeon]